MIHVTKYVSSAYDSSYLRNFFENDFFKHEIMVFSERTKRRRMQVADQQRDTGKREGMMTERQQSLSLKYHIYRN